MILYHGSDHVIKCPTFGGGNDGNDYGRGFYTTQIKERAEDWAFMYGTAQAVVNQYTLDVTALNILNLDSYGPLAWIAEVAYNRRAVSFTSKTFARQFITKYKLNTSDADIMIGFRADDSYGDIIDAFMSAEITVDEVKRLFWKGDLGHQVFIKSKKAFSQLRFDADYQPAYNPKGEQNIIASRKDVLHFLQNRRLQIARRFVVPTITIIDAIEDDYIYNGETGYYETR